MGADKDERRGVKVGIDKDDCRKNRAAQKVELRKAKRDEGLQKRRNMQEVTIVPNAEIADVSDPEAASKVEATSNEVASMSFEQHTQICLGFVARNGRAEEYDDTLCATRALRKQLSMARNPPIDACIDANLVPTFVTMLGHPESKMQFEAAWCLTNIASGTSKQCDVVIKNNGVPPLVALMGSPSLDVCEQAVWAIGNIAGDCPELRDLVLQNGAVERVIAMVEATASMGQMGPLRNAVWALSNLMRGKPQPAMAFVNTAVPILAKLLMIADDEVLMDTCWALSYVTDGGDDRIDLAVLSGTVPLLMNILKERTDSKTRTPALRTLCNILTGSATATQAVIEAGILDCLPESIRSTKAQTRKEACWAISNSTLLPPPPFTPATLHPTLPPSFSLPLFRLAASPSTSHGLPKCTYAPRPSTHMLNLIIEQSRLELRSKWRRLYAARCWRRSSSVLPTTSTRSRRRPRGSSPTFFTALQRNRMPPPRPERRPSCNSAPSRPWSRCSK